MLLIDGYMNALLTKLILCRVIESFEGVAAVFAQQLPLNEKQNFTTSSVTLVAEMVQILKLTTCTILRNGVLTLFLTD